MRAVGISGFPRGYFCFRKVYRDCMSNGTGVVETNNTAAKAEIEHLMNEVFGPW